jgi:hypothetical protein
MTKIFSLGETTPAEWQCAGRNAKMINRKESNNMAKRHEYTSPRVATKASKILSNPRSSKAAKSAAASALTQARNRKGR